MKRDALRNTQAAKLRRLLCEVYPRNAFYRHKLEEAAFDSSLLTSEPSLERLLESLPLTTKEEIQADQCQTPPYGTNLTYPADRYTRVHRTSGTTGRPIYWLDTTESWQWFVDCWKEVYRGIRLDPGDRILLPFSFGPFIGFWGAFEAAVQLGNFVLPAGGMGTVARLRYLLEHRVTVVACTPTYGLHMAEVAEEEGIDLAGSPVRKLLVAGEPGGSIPSTRERLEAAWGARCLDHSGMTEIGSVSFECWENPGGVHVVEEEFIVEILEPGGGQAVGAGEAGELVLTNLGRFGSPLIRYRTGDLVRFSQEPCPCGRPTGRLVGGILGRMDDMVQIRGNNVYPAAIESVIRAFPEVAEYRVRVLESGGMNSLRLELEPFPDCADSDRLAERAARAIQTELLFRADVHLVAPGTLPRFELKARRFERVREGAVSNTPGTGKMQR